MKIENNTKWTTAHLRAVARRTLQQVVSPAVRKSAFVVFDTAKGFRVTGYAYHEQVYRTRHYKKPYWLTHVRVPSPNGQRTRVTTGRTNIDVSVIRPESKFAPGALQVEIAQVIAHETGHWSTDGIKRKNRDLRGSHIHDPYTPESRERFSWAATMLLEPATQKKADPLTTESRRVRDYERKVKESQTKVKRANTVLARWTRRLALAQNRLAKAASPKETA